MITDRDWRGPSSNGETQVPVKFSSVHSLRSSKPCVLDNPISNPVLEVTVNQSVWKVNEGREVISLSLWWKGKVGINHEVV